MGDVVSQWLVRRTWDLKVESSSPGRCTHVVVLGKTLNSRSASLHPGVEMGTSKSAKVLGSNLRWTSIPSRGSRNTPSRLLLQKPEIPDGLMGLLARPITIGADFTLPYLSRYYFS